MPCDNCGRTLTDHCRVHLIPCCPGKCPGFGRRQLPESPVRRSERLSEAGEGEAGWNCPRPVEGREKPVQRREEDL